jgi:hypothetical protein
MQDLLSRGKNYVGPITALALVLLQVVIGVADLRRTIFLIASVTAAGLMVLLVIWYLVNRQRLRAATAAFGLCAVGLLAWRGAPADEVRTGRASGAAVLPAQTLVSVVRPYPDGSAMIKSDYRIAGQGTGDCSQHSFLSARPDMYRCFEGHIIHDPCFAASTYRPKQVACLPKPWSNQVQILDVPRPLMDSQRVPTMDILSNRPWALELVTGPRCFAVSGATGGSAGFTITYLCDNDAFLYETPNQQPQMWTILYSQNEDQDLVAVQIRQVWF